MLDRVGVKTTLILGLCVGTYRLADTFPLTQRITGSFSAITSRVGAGLVGFGVLFGIAGLPADALTVIIHTNRVSVGAIVVVGFLRATQVLAGFFPLTTLLGGWNAGSLGGV